MLEFTLTISSSSRVLFLSFTCWKKNLVEHHIQETVTGEAIQFSLYPRNLCFKPQFAQTYFQTILTFHVQALIVELPILHIFIQFG